VRGIEKWKSRVRGILRGISWECEHMSWNLAIGRITQTNLGPASKHGPEA